MMKTTFELPDTLFRKAKAGASMRGMSLRQFFTDAIAEKIRGARPGNGQRPWMRHFGALKKYSRELDKVDRIVAQEFETIHADDWK